ncbi:hypothetical protein TPY_2600 [Sulfobacillus acidophilus TPY]|nr:hypothetical protein TPY_2600 [Sulfobacillus acidophilus TPY]
MLFNTAINIPTLVAESAHHLYPFGLFGIRHSTSLVNLFTSYHAPLSRPPQFLLWYNRL